MLICFSKLRVKKYIFACIFYARNVRRYLFERKLLRLKHVHQRVFEIFICTRKPRVKKCILVCIFYVRDVCRYLFERKLLRLKHLHQRVLKCSFA